MIDVVLALMIDRASDGELFGSFGRALLPVTAVLMTIVGLFATMGPARRGLSIQPTEALRADSTLEFLKHASRIANDVKNSDQRSRCGSILETVEGRQSKSNPRTT